MKKEYTYYIVAAAAALLVLLLLVRGCGEDEQSVELGPSETAEAFCRALAAGRFDEAKGLCDTIAMADYINTYIAAFEEAVQNNGKAADIAAGILEEMEFSVSDIVKEDGRRQVFYTIGLSDGTRKEKIATMTKEEGAWKVEAITERN